MAGLDPGPSVRTRASGTGAEKKALYSQQGSSHSSSPQTSVRLRPPQTSNLTHSTPQATRETVPPAPLALPAGALCNFFIFLSFFSSFFVLAVFVLFDLLSFSYP